MFVSNIKNLDEIKVTAPGVVNAFKKSLIGPLEGWDGWVMRLFTLRDRGCSPRHAHPWPHINFIMCGRGLLYAEGKETALEEGSIAYVPSNAEHQFSSTTDEDFAFICIVPEEGDK
jgi:quercetin dioxygenase-like cupin family protein